MGDTKISWADKVWNPVRGCTRVSEGCRNCYAEQSAAGVNAKLGARSKYTELVQLVSVRQMQVNLATGEPTGKMRDRMRARWTGKVAFDPVVLAQPLKRRKPTTYFVNSMSDLFHDGFTFEQIAAVFGVMAACPQHTFIVLTKRAERMREWFEWLSAKAADLALFPDEEPIQWRHGHLVRAAAIRAGAGDRIGILSDRWPLPNVILGVSAERQQELDERVPHLLATPAAVRLVSAEPLLGPIVIPREYLAPFHDLDPMLRPAPRIGWLIAGCESGTGARPCEVNWLRSLRDQCVAAEVPFWLKQAVRETDRGDPVVVFGPGSTSKPGGIIELPYLDGVQWAQRPEVRP